MTRMKRRGEIGSPRRRPLYSEKKSVGEPLTRTPKEVIGIHQDIHPIHLSPRVTETHSSHNVNKTLTVHMIIKFTNDP